MERVHPGRVGPSQRFALALTAVAVVGCGLLVDPERTCADHAAGYGPAFRVAGAFVTTAARTRMLYDGAEQTLPETRAADGETVVLCYLDGELPKGPPPDGGVVPPSFDRAMVAVIGDSGIPLVLGYQADLPVADPKE